jgi:hypothetical protein
VISTNKKIKTMEVNRVQKKIRVTPYDLVKYQIITDLIFFKKEHLIPSDIEILTMLALWGPVELSKFCNTAAKKMYGQVEPEEFSIRAQNIRNRISKLEKRHIVTKSAINKKLIQITPAIDIHRKGNILLDYNILSLEPNKA